MPTRSTLRERLASRRLVLCMALLQARTPDVVLAAAASGFDAVYVDLEHSPASYETASMLTITAAGCGIAGLARVPSHDPDHATRLLDGGAEGLIIPHVDTAQEAQRIVAACRFPPRGNRSMVGAVPALGYRRHSAAETIRELERHQVLIAMIETPEAVANAEAIAAVEGIDMLLVGSADLSAAMQIPGEYESDAMSAAYARVAQACRDSGKSFGIGGVRGQPKLHSKLVALGANFLIMGSDIGYLLQAASADCADIRSLTAEAA